MKTQLRLRDRRAEMGRAGCRIRMEPSPAGMVVTTVVDGGRQQVTLRPAAMEMMAAELGRIAEGREGRWSDGLPWRRLALGGPGPGGAARWAIKGERAVAHLDIAPGAAAGLAAEIRAWRSDHVARRGPTPLRRPRGPGRAPQGRRPGRGAGRLGL